MIRDSMQAWFFLVGVRGGVKTSGLTFAARALLFLRRPTFVAIRLVPQRIYLVQDTSSKRLKKHLSREKCQIVPGYGIMTCHSITTNRPAVDRSRYRH
jgi:hypothetical protein